MARVIAVQEIQLNKLRENYSKSLPDKTVTTTNNADVLSGLLDIPNVDAQNTVPIDMESQVVNLNSQPYAAGAGVTNYDTTNEVFGPQMVSEPANNNDSVLAEQNIFGGNVQDVSKSILNTETNFSSMEVPYQEPEQVDSTVPVNVLSDESFYELLNSLRNMITDFANSAYAKIDKFQEERLQNKNTGANLISVADSDMSKGEMADANSFEQPSIVSDSGVNVFDNQAITDFDKTVVIPGEVITNAVAEVENAQKMVA